jgi:hypothetical protein
MCVGALMLLFPPSVASACYGTYYAGQATTISQLKLVTPPASSALSNGEHLEPSVAQ